MVMEDYQTAFLRCVNDVEALDCAGRRIAAMHFGGVAIECLLKYMIFSSLPAHTKKEWKTEANDPGHTFANPGHSYAAALGCLNRIQFRMRQARWVQKCLDEVENPDCHFIDMRYHGIEPDENRYKQWKNSYRSLLGWLQRQATQL
jgi:hypothetical protein